MTSGHVRRHAGESRRRRASILGRFGVAIALLTVFGLGVGADRVIFRSGAGAGAQSTSIADIDGFETFQETWDLIHDQFVDVEGIDDQALLYGASRGMVDSLGDTDHSVFLDPEEAAAFEASRQSTAVGVGIWIEEQCEQYVILETPEGSPAREGGIEAGDVLLEVDGVDLAGKTLEQLLDILTGDEGSQVELVLRHSAEEDPYTVELTREAVAWPQVTWAMLPGHVAHVWLMDFDRGAREALRGALEDALDAGAESIIFDLRHNPGGLKREAIGVASEFLDEGETIFIEHYRGSEPETINVRGDGLARDLPMVVIVDEMSGSSSEVVAAALQDNDRAEIIGEQTPGLATIINSFELEDGSVARLAVGAWQTPDGDDIWKVGVTPDEYVDLPCTTTPDLPSADANVTRFELKASSDVQLQAAYDALART